MGNPLHAHALVRALRSPVPTKKTPQSATNTFGAKPSSFLDGLAYSISPLLPESQWRTSDKSNYGNVPGQQHGIVCALFCGMMSSTTTLRESSGRGGQGDGPLQRTLHEKNGSRLLCTL
jgi:hypothetical protein